MIVLKFGGTSLQDASCIKRAGEIVGMQRQKHRVVVVSAIAKATATLKAAGQRCAQGDRNAAGEQINALLDEHRNLVGELGVGGPNARSWRSWMHSARRSE
jgi:aspartate kinase